MAHTESFIFNIAIADMRRLTSSTLNVSNIGQNTNVPIHEIVCVSSPSYFLDWFEISYPNVPLNIDEVTFLYSMHELNSGNKINQTTMKSTP